MYMRSETEIQKQGFINDLKEKELILNILSS